MALTDDELALLGTLAYLEKSDVLDYDNINDFWNGAYENDGKTLGYVLDKVADDSVIADLRSEGKRDQKDSLRITGAEWADALEAARGNESIRSLSYVDVDSFAEDGSRAFCFASGDQAYVVYRGTGSDPTSGGSEWADNFDGLWQSDTHAQRAALNYAEYAHALTGLDVTVTGHSKGGNKAMYAAVRSPHVARCVSFDGQGFGTAFLARHGALVAKRAGVIGAYNLDGDFVSPLLRPIAGKMVWLNGSRANGDLLKNHSPIALFGESAALASGADRGALSVQVGRFSDFLLHAVPEGQLRPLADLLGDAASIALGGVEGDLLSVVAGNPEGLGTLAALLMSYPGTDDLLGAVEDEAVPGSDLLLDVLGALGLGPRSPLARQAGGFALAGMDAAFLGMLLSEALGLDAGWAGAFARSYAAGRAGIKPGAGPLAGGRARLQRRGARRAALHRAGGGGRAVVRSLHVGRVVPGGGVVRPPDHRQLPARPRLVLQEGRGRQRRVGAGHRPHLRPRRRARRRLRAVALGHPRKPRVGRPGARRGAGVGTGERGRYWMDGP